MYQQSRVANLLIRVVNLTFLKPEFEILLLNTLGFFWKSKNARQNLAFSGFFQSKRLSSGKTLSELHIDYKYPLTRVFYHTGYKEYFKDFTVALKIIDVIYKKTNVGQCNYWERKCF